MSADLIRQKARERHFLEQLLDGKKLENYKIPVPIKAELRKYQQVGVLLCALSLLHPRGELHSAWSSRRPCSVLAGHFVTGRSELALVPEQIQVARDPV